MSNKNIYSSTPHDFKSYGAFSYRPKNLVICSSTFASGLVRKTDASLELPCKHDAEGFFFCLLSNLEVRGSGFVIENV